MKRTKYLGYWILILCILISAALACNLPTGGNSRESAANDIQEQLSQLSTLQLRSVSIDEQTVQITIDQTVGHSQPGTYSTWVALLTTAAQAAPHTPSVTLNIFLFDDPYLTINAQTSDIEALQAGEIDLPMFFERLQITDERPPQAAIRQGLGAAGWLVTAIEVSSESVDIEFSQPQPENAQDIALTWFKAFQLAAEHAPDSQRVTLHVLLAEAPNLTVTAAMPHIKAFLNGDIDAVEFMSNWIVSE